MFLQMSIYLYNHKQMYLDKKYYYYTFYLLFDIFYVLNDKKNNLRRIMNHNFKHYNLQYKTSELNIL